MSNEKRAFKREGRDKLKWIIARAAVKDTHNYGFNGIVAVANQHEENSVNFIMCFSWCIHLSKLLYLFVRGFSANVNHIMHRIKRF